MCVSFIDHFYMLHTPSRQFAGRFHSVNSLVRFANCWNYHFAKVDFFFTFVTIGGILFFFYFEKMRKKSHKPVHSMLTLFIEVQVCLLPLPVHKLPIKITKHVFVVLSSFIFIQFIFVLSIFYNILIVLTFENCKWNYKNTQSTKSLTCIQGRYSSETIWISSFYFLAILVMRNCCIVSTNRQNRKFDLNNCQYSKHRSFVYFFLSSLFFKNLIFIFNWLLFFYAAFAFQVFARVKL